MCQSFVLLLHGYQGLLQVLDPLISDLLSVSLHQILNHLLADADVGF
jgi:hypothetical protein